MARPQLTKGNNSVALPILSYPNDLGAPEERFALVRTSGGGVKTLDWSGGASGRWFQRTLSLRVTQDEYDAIAAFIWSDAVQGPEGVFTYTDPAGQAHDQVRYAGGLDTAEASAYDQIEFTLRLVRDEV